MIQELHLTLPGELKKEFTLEKILLVKSSSILCSLKKKSSFSENVFILKIIPKAQYNKTICEKLLCLSESRLLTPLQEYHTRHFIYFIFPKLQSLSYLVKSGKMDFHHIKELAADIGTAILSLHKEHIFHMDIAPGNIYLNENGHFILGDFSSARLYRNRSSKIEPCLLDMPDLRNHFPPAKSIFSHFKMHPTGSTKGFYPEHLSSDKSPLNYDLYGFFMILYLLLNQGKSPFDEKPETTEEKSHEKINTLIKSTLDECDKKPLPSHFFEMRFSELRCLLDEVKEQKTPGFFQPEIPGLENRLFCSFTEPEEKSFPAAFLYDKNMKLFSFEKKPSLITIPKSLFSKESFHKSALYGLLMVCGFLFLFACYHYISKKQRQSESKTQIETRLTGEDSSPLEGGEVSGFSYTLPPPETESPASEKPALDYPDNTALPQRKHLNLAGKGLKTISSSSKIWKAENITIIFAQKNCFSNIHPFLPFKNVKELYLSQNFITSVQGIQKLKHLEVLDLSGNRLQELSALSSLTHLKILDLCGQTHLKNISGLKNLKSLEYLILTNTNVKAADIARLKKLLPSCSILF